MDRLSPVRRFLNRHPAAQVFAVVYLLLLTVALGVLLADRLNEGARAEARARTAAIAFCSKTRGEALAPLLTTSSEFARNNVRGAIAAYAIGECDSLIGPLPLDRVDPEAFRVAPSPQPSRPPG